MKKFLLASAVLALLGVSVTMSVVAQPPGGDRPDSPPPFQRDGRGPGQEGRPPMPNPIMAALDKDGDREISADEIKEATASLLTLDKNGDGKLTDDEIRPPRPEGFGPDGPQGGRRPDSGPPGEGRGDGPPGGREGAGRGDGPPGGREGAGRGRMGQPNPERFVEDAMRFDADKDGKLDKAELMKFAQEMASRQGRPPEGGQGDGGGGGGSGRPEGDRPPGDRPPGERSENQEGDRPRRPAAE